MKKLLVGYVPAILEKLAELAGLRALVMDEDEAQSLHAVLQNKGYGSEVQRALLYRIARLNSY